jgi:hypothetical protein
VGEEGGERRAEGTVVALDPGLRIVATERGLQGAVGLAELDRADPAPRLGHEQAAEG